MFAAKNFFLAGGPAPYLGPATIEYLVIAGGGSGSGSTGLGGGGGAGGYRTASGFSVTGGSPITVTVGAGGVDTGNNNAGKGNNSVFSSITSTDVIGQ